MTEALGKMARGERAVKEVSMAKVFAADVATGRAHDLLAGTGLGLQPWDPSAEHYDLSPDGSELALTVDLHPEPAMMNESDIVVVSIATGRHRTLTAGSGFGDANPRYSPDGRYLVWNSYNLKRAFNDPSKMETRRNDSKYVSVRALVTSSRNGGVSKK